jgi:hypothetical protein
MVKLYGKSGLEQKEGTIRIVLPGENGRVEIRELTHPSIEGEGTAKLIEDNRAIFLDSDNDHLYLWVRFKDSKDLGGAGAYVYILKKDDKSIWHGSIVSDASVVNGKSANYGTTDYTCLLSSMKSYLGELFLSRPNDMRVLDALYELNRQYDGLTDIFVRMLAKMKGKKGNS